MTKEFIRQLNKALALIAIGCGGLGMAVCTPYLFLNNWTIVGVTAVCFLACAVLYGSGAVSMAILVKDEA